MFIWPPDYHFYLQVCATLAILAGNHHQWLGGIAGGISAATMNHTMHRVVNAINSDLKQEFLIFPSNDQLELLGKVLE